MSSEDILFNEKPAACGLIGEVILNRPKALNALTLDMCQQFAMKLSQWDKQDEIKAVIVKGTGDRAFCAGGDIRKLYEYRHLDVKLLRQFFWHEYRLNIFVHHFSKPYFSFLHHFVMGGGAGISINGAFRIAADNLVFAMPETTIGFYPDIGALYFFNQCPGYMGLYLALTGNSVNAVTAKALGLVTHLIPENQFNAAETLLLETQTISGSLLEPLTTKPEGSELSTHIETINHCFSLDSVTSIIQALEQGSDWAKAIAQQLHQRPSTSLKVTFHAYQRARTMTFNETMQMNFDLTQQFVRASDFFEGVRAAIIDKDQNPSWKPEISDHDLTEYFKFKGLELNT